MPDLGGFNSVALQVQQPNALGTLGNIMNIAGSAQQLKRGTQDIEQKEIELQKQRQQNYERVAGQNFFSSPDNWQTDGHIDMDKINATVPKIMPLTGPDVIGKLSNLSTAETNAASARLKLTQDKREIVAGPIGILGRSGVTDPAAYVKELQHLKTIYPDDKDLGKLVDSYSTILSANPNGPHVPKAAVTLSQSLLGAGAQQTSLSPTAGLTSTGGALREAVTQPAVGGNAPSVSLTGRSEPMTPTSGETMATDALGRPYIQTRSPTGELGAKPPPGSDYRPLLTLPAGETPDTAKPLFALRDQTQAAAASVPTQHFNNAQILRLADSSFTGTGSPELAKILNSVGLQQTTGDAAKDTAQLMHFIKLQAVNNAAAQGANTDAARALVEQAVQPPGAPAQAIKSITKINDAFATGVDLFNKGMQKAAAGQNDIFGVRQFQNAWTANMDPRIFQLENAVKAGDKAEVERIKRDLGTEGVRQLLIKAHNLKALVSTGAPPQ